MANVRQRHEGTQWLKTSLLRRTKSSDTLQAVLSVKWAELLTYLEEVLGADRNLLEDRSGERGP